MKYPFFASFIVFIILFSLRMNRQKKSEKKQENDYWEKELEANATRRKSLDNLDYISIPFDTLPMDIMADIPEIQEYHTRLQDLAGEKIVNFTGLSNTELKLTYGAPNINLLTEYDQNYTQLVTLLQNWAGALLTEAEKTDPASPASPETLKQAAKSVLEYSVSIGTDIYASYEALAGLYLEDKEAEKLSHLKETAASVRSLSQKRILSMLDKKAQTPSA